jgi:hypothetical protein
MKTDEILLALERCWEAGSLPGRQAAEGDSVLRELWRLVQIQQQTTAPARLRLVRA